MHAGQVLVPWLQLKRTERWMQFLEALKFTSQPDGSLLLREEE